MQNNDLLLLMEEYVENPDSPDINFEIALEYEKLGQLASALTFFLRTAEFGFESAPSLTYVSLLKIGLILEELTDRKASVSNSFLHAVAYQPSRPEAYFLLSRHYERTKAWQESYTFSLIGQQFVSYRSEPTSANIEYSGEHCLIFQQAVAAWWVGRKSESKDLFDALLSNYEMEESYIASCLNNLKLWP